MIDFDRPWTPQCSNYQGELSVYRLGERLTRDEASTDKMEVSFDKKKTLQEIQFQDLKLLLLEVLSKVGSGDSRQDILAVQHQLGQLRVSLRTNITTKTATPSLSGASAFPTNPTLSSKSERISQDPIKVMRIYAQTARVPCLAVRSDAIGQIALDLVQIIFAVTIAATYQALQRGKSLNTLKISTAEDVLHACLLGYVVLTLFGSAKRVPRLITGMSDDSISLQTALGEELRIPSLQWREYPVLHGFLESYFRDRPGIEWVKRKSYRIMLGGTTGLVIDEQRWTTVISKHMKLTMAMLLDEDSRCPRCQQSLEVSLSDGKFWYVQASTNSSFQLTEATVQTVQRDSGHYHSQNRSNRGESL